MPTDAADGGIAASSPKVADELLYRNPKLLSGDPSVTQQPAEPKKKTDDVTRLWRLALLWMKRGLAFITTFSSIAVAGWVFVLTADAVLKKHTLDIGVIGVPKKLVDDGYSSEVVTKWLRDAIHSIQQSAHTRMATQGVSLNEDMSTITIPGSGISLINVAASIRGFLPEGWQHEITGEFISSEPNLSLRLRINSKIVFSGVASGADAAPTLIKTGAMAIIVETQPYVAALAFYKDKKPDKAIALADGVIDYQRADFIDEIPWFHNLRGNILIDRHDFEAASREFALALSLASKLPRVAAVTHINIGRLEGIKKNYDTAIAEYQMAIQLDPTYAVAHNNLCAMLKLENILDKAIDHCRIAITLDRDYALPHINLGDIWRKKREWSSATSEYESAAKLEPESGSPHYLLGLVWNEQARTVDAIAEFRAAVRTDSKYVPAYLALSSLLQEQAMSNDAGTKERVDGLRNACAAIVDGERAVPNEVSFTGKMAKLDSLLAGDGHCPPK